MNDNDRIRLQHILDAAREAQAFASGKTRDDVFSDRKLLLILVKEVEIIGEAANNLSGELKERCNHIPWRDIIAMRNRLIHAYFDVNPDFVWDTVTNDLAPLVAEVRKILEAEKRK